MNTYVGWSRECLQDWGSYIHLAVPGMVMLCVEWWTYEIGGFLAGNATGHFGMPLTVEKQL